MHTFKCPVWQEAWKLPLLNLFPATSNFSFLFFQSLSRPFRWPCTPYLCSETSLVPHIGSSLEWKIICLYCNLQTSYKVFIFKIITLLFFCFPILFPSYLLKFSSQLLSVYPHNHAHCCSDNKVRLYSGSVRFKFWLGHKLSGWSS
jgi:hypothetical protein